MYMLRTPQEAYRRIDFDARVVGADPRQLLALCFEQLVSALGSALYAAEHGDNRLKSHSLTRALSALTALQMGVDRDQPIAPALFTLYEAARRAVLDSVLDFDDEKLALVRQDFIDISAAITSS